MRSLGETIRTRRRSLALSLDDLARRARCAKSYLSQIENGRRGNPPSDAVLRRIAAALDLPESGLLAHAAWRATPEPVRDNFRRLAAMLNGNNLDAAHRSGALQALVAQIAPDDAPAPSGAPQPVSLERVVPLINLVRAGCPTEFTDLGYPARIADEYVRAPGLSDPDAFAARIVGDSMAPWYEDGDIVVFSPERDAADGADCFVRLERDNETTFKRVYFERGDRGEELIRLQPLNRAYPPRVLPRDEVAGLYVAVWVMRPVRPA